MPDLFSFENLAHLAGIAGFVLALILAILEWYWRTTRLDVSSADAYACEADDGRIMLLLRFVVSNCSSLSFALTGFSFKRGILTSEIPAMLDPIAVIRSDKDPSLFLSNDSCPIPVEAYGAARCSVLFSYEAAPKSALYPPKLKRKEYSFDSINPFARSRKKVDNWKIHLFIYTSRGKKRTVKNLKVTMLSTSEVRAILDQRLNHKFI